MMFELMPDKERWQIINQIISDRLDYFIEADIEDPDHEDICPECGLSQHLTGEGYHCHGTICIHCGHEEVFPDW